VVQGPALARPKLEISVVRGRRTVSASYIISRLWALSKEETHQARYRTGRWAYARLVRLGLLRAIGWCPVCSHPMFDLAEVESVVDKARPSDKRIDFCVVSRDADFTEDYVAVDPLFLTSLTGLRAKDVRKYVAERKIKVVRHIADFTPSKLRSVKDPSEYLGRRKRNHRYVLLLPIALLEKWMAMYEERIRQYELGVPEPSFRDTEEYPQDDAARSIGTLLRAFEEGE